MDGVSDWLMRKVRKNKFGICDYDYDEADRDGLYRFKME
jgi:hypothetical protein